MNVETLEKLGFIEVVTPSGIVEMENIGNGHRYPIRVFGIDEHGNVTGVYNYGVFTNEYSNLRSLI